jgi:hypothetical protein
MKIEPTMYMKTQGGMTIWPIISRTFWSKMHQFCDMDDHPHGIRAGSVQVMGSLRRCRDPDRLTRIIGPSLHRLRAESFFDSRMSRWPDEPNASPFHYVLANKMG